MGTVGTVYMGLLIVILIIGFGLLAKKMFLEPILSFGTNNTHKQRGDKVMFNKWFKLALVSFIGLIISGFALGLISSGSSGGTAHEHGGMSNNMPASSNNVNGSSASQAQLNMLLQRMNQMEMRMNNIMYNGNYSNFNMPYSNNTGINPSGTSQGNQSSSGSMPMM